MNTSVQRRLIHAVLPIATGAALMFSIPTSAAEIDFKVGTSWNENFPMKALLEDILKPNLDAYSDGRISTEVHMSGTLCSQKTCVEQVKLGQLDIGTSSVSNYGGFHKTLEILTLPYIFSDNEAAQKILSEFLFDELQQKSSEEDNMKVLAVVPFLGFRQLETNVGPIREPKDLNGVKIRVTTSPLDGALLRAWGAVSTPIAWSETYDAIQQKVVSGLYVQQPVHAMMKFHEVTKYVTLTDGAWTPMMIFMDRNRFEELPVWAQEAVDKAAADIREQSFAIDQEYIKNIGEANADKAEFYTPTAEEATEWRNASAEAWLVASKLKLYDPALARRILESQSGTEEFVSQLDELGVL
ncbi:TRAP transporter substrate-binding protein [Granulosicoccus sp.]|nr:TRAP transporter substrate-binding protein [Granulosicoccus sp.]